MRRSRRSRGGRRANGAVTVGKRARLGNDEGESTDDEDADALLVSTVHDRVYFYAEVSRTSVLRLFKAMHEAAASAARTGRARIFLHIHSDGGCAHSGLNAMHHIRHFHMRVVTVGDAYLASAASLLFLGGHERWLPEHATVLIHQVRVCVVGKYDELCDEYRNTTRIMDALKEIYTTETTMTIEQVTRCLTTEETLSARACLDCRFAHRLLPLAPSAPVCGAVDDEVETAAWHLVTMSASPAPRCDESTS